MTIRQNYIDQFKTLLKFKGKKVYFSNQDADGNSNTSNLADGIANILRELNFKMLLQNNIHTPPDNNTSIYVFNNPIYPNSIFLKTNYENIYSWQIFPSKKWHNNTTMICYLMRKLLK